MTPEEFLEMKTGKQLAIAMGPGIPLAAAAVFGTSFAGDDWSRLADGVLRTAMTPVSVLAATATVLFTGALSANDSDGGSKRSQAITLVSVVYVMLTIFYFMASLAALSVPKGMDAKEDLTSLSFALLGVVLGSMLSIVVLVVLFHQSDDGPEPGESTADGRDGPEGVPGA